MTDKLTVSELNKNQKLLPQNVAFDSSFYVILAAVVFFSYGYEIFNFNLTIDEEIHAINSGKWNEWIAQGRWGMAILNYVLLPNPITPVVSVFLGVTGTVVGILIFIKDSFKLRWIDTLSIVTLAITTPTLAFTFTFSTLAYGIGFAFLAISFGNTLIYRRNWMGVLFACVFTAFAISIYQTFLFVLIMFIFIHVWRLQTESYPDKVIFYKHLATYFFLSVFFYILLSSLALKLASLDIKYVGQFVNIKGFIDNPGRIILSSAGRVLDVFRLQPGLFGTRSVWLSVVLFISIAFSFAYPLLNKNYLKFLYSISLSVAILLIIVFADAIAQGGAPLRSVIYIPVAIAIIVGVAFSVVGVFGGHVLVTLCLLAIIGNSMVNNHLFASSAAAEFRDKVLAAEIIHDVRRLAPSKTDYDVLKVEVIGNKTWPSTGIQSKTETFGASFFEWDGGNRYRVAAFLKLNGLAAIGATDRERVLAYAEQKSMPAWPHAGWISLFDDILILKFGDYSLPQRTSLCSHGVVELCH